MGYLYMSNISDFTKVTSNTTSYQVIGKASTTSSPISNGSPGVINFNDGTANQEANFIMIRAHEDNDLLVQLYPSKYCVYIPGGELWSADLLEPAQKIIVRNIFDATTTNNVILSSGKIQWMIGYK